MTPAATLAKRADGAAGAETDRILVVPAAVRATLYDLLHTEIGRLRCKARETRFAWKRRQLEARAEGLRRLADELAR